MEGRRLVSGMGVMGTGTVEVVGVVEVGISPSKPTGFLLRRRRSTISRGGEQGRSIGRTPLQRSWIPNSYPRLWVGRMGGLLRLHLLCHNSMDVGHLVPGQILMGMVGMGREMMGMALVVVRRAVNMLAMVKANTMGAEVVEDTMVGLSSNILGRQEEEVVAVAVGQSAIAITPVGVARAIIKEDMMQMETQSAAGAVVVAAHRIIEAATILGMELGMGDVEGSGLCGRER